MQGSTQHITPSSHVINDDALTHVYNLCQKPCELREEEVEITKNVMVLDEEEALVTYEDKELEEEEEDIDEKTLYDITEEEKKDVYDPAVLGKMLIHCHFFV